MWVRHVQDSGAVGSNVLATLPSLQFRQNPPYTLFLVLDGRTEEVLAAPECLWDPLTHSVLAVYDSDDALKSRPCQAVVEALASLYELDIASVEATHSTIREFWKLCSRGLAPSLETVSAKFVQKRSSWNPQFYAGGRAKNTGRRTQRGRKAKKTATKIRRGGGPWRAFIHGFRPQLRQPRSGPDLLQFRPGVQKHVYGCLSGIAFIRLLLIWVVSCNMALL